MPARAKHAVRSKTVAPARPRPARPSGKGTAGGHPFAVPPSPDQAPATPPPVEQLSAISSIVVRDGPFTVKAYRGDGCVMIAMDVTQSACQGLAGFAIARSKDGKTFTYAKNRLSFKPAKAVDASTTTEARLANAETTDIAPYQKFRWVDYPPEEPVPTPITYRIEAMYFVTGKDPAAGAGALVAKNSVTFAMSLIGKVAPKFDVAFTRGYVSSQAFVDRYGSNVKSLRFDESVGYDTTQTVAGTSTTPPTTYKDMYRWLGARARQILYDFLVQCEADGTATGSGYDVFAYDLDEPDFLRVLVRDAKRGWPIRMVLDDSPLHTKPGAREIAAAALLQAAGVIVVRGHFTRFAHDKCVIQRDKAGNAVRVLTGSANFSVRGLYVQSNSMIVIDAADVAKLYGEAFDQAFKPSGMPGFPKAPIAAQWFDESLPDLPKFSVSFAPHADAGVSLKRVADAIKNAKSSVLFAVMELGGGGDVLAQLGALQQRPDVFSYGVTQNVKGFTLTKHGQPGVLVPFGYLHSKVPVPFRAEWNGGMGQVIHHKFVVIDFNDPNPVVFCGSSNLAQGGEQANGDNLLAIEDPAVAALYAVEAIQLVDHYDFRAAASQATAPGDTLSLHGPDENPQWWEAYYDPADLKSRERQVLVS
jgi:hypothetical protein